LFEDVVYSGRFRSAAAGARSPDTSTERESDVSDTSLVNVTESAATALGGIDFSASGAGAIRVYFMGFG